MKRIYARASDKLPHNWPTDPEATSARRRLEEYRLQMQQWHKENPCAEKEECVAASVAILEGLE